MDERSSNEKKAATREGEVDKTRSGYPPVIAIGRQARWATAPKERKVLTHRRETEDASARAGTRQASGKRDTAGQSWQRPRKKRNFARPRKQTRFQNASAELAYRPGPEAGEQPAPHDLTSGEPKNRGQLQIRHESSQRVRHVVAAMPADREKQKPVRMITTCNDRGRWTRSQKAERLSTGDGRSADVRSIRSDITDSGACSRLAQDCRAGLGGILRPSPCRPDRLTNR